MISRITFTGGKEKAFVLLLMLSLLMCGFGARSAEASWNETDHAGYEVSIPENPERILALNPLLMEGLFALGLSPVGKVDEYGIRKEGIGLPSVGSQPNVDIESVYTLNPSLVIGHIRFHGAIARTLRQDGVAVYLVDPGKMGNNPMLDSVMFLGRLLRREDAARSYADTIHNLARKLKERIFSETDIRSGVVIQDGDRIAAAQNATSYGSVLTALGIGNIVPDDIPGSNKENFIAFDIETIIASDPDVVFIVASSNNAEQNRAAVEKYMRDSKWSGLKAVRTKRVLTLPFKVNPGRATAEEMLRIAAETLLKNE